MDITETLRPFLFALSCVFIWGLFQVWKQFLRAPHPVEASEGAQESPLTSFLRDPDPDTAFAALREYLASPLAATLANPAWYLFARLAELHPALISQYGELFEAAPSAALLLILTQCGNDETRATLARCASRPGPLQESIATTVHNWQPGLLKPLASPPANAADLDFLWCEFLVTRDLKAASMVLDVLEWPDWFGGKLRDWLLRASPAEASEGSAVLLRELRVLCDPETRELLSRQDLDCTILMNGINVDKARADKLIPLLPFPVNREEVAASSAWIKAAARWSLACHAQEFAEVHDLCERESSARTGRCRLALLEILARLAGGDNVEAMMNWFDAAVHSEHREARSSAIAPEWDRLKSLPFIYPETHALLPLSEDAAARCVNAFEDIPSYRTRVVLSSQENVDAPAITWEAEIGRGGRFFVTQTITMTGSRSPTRIFEVPSMLLV